MTMPGFTAEAALDRGHVHYRSGPGAGRDAGGVFPALLLDTGLDTGLDAGLDTGADLGIGPDLTGTCAQTTVCGACQRVCIQYPFYRCFSFQQCRCTTKGGNTKFFARPCA
ncbi:MAG TPA: hypothetical protein VNZ44_01095 [Pyrinomonadaceae bacterium]|nr:hypothetical protein [Pyrinomonadaceae bacterium]